MRKTYNILVGKHGEPVRRPRRRWEILELGRRGLDASGSD